MCVSVSGFSVFRSRTLTHQKFEDLGGQQKWIVVVVWKIRHIVLLTVGVGSIVHSFRTLLGCGKFRCRAFSAPFSVFGRPSAVGVATAAKENRRGLNGRWQRSRRLELNSDPFVFSVLRVLCGLLFISLLLSLFRFPTSPRLPSDRSVVGVDGDVGIDGASILV